MENKICEERSIDVIIDAKERAIISLYAKQNNLNEETVEFTYFSSKLRNIIRDKESGLYLESPYYILERYSEYMKPINIYKNNNNMEHLPYYATSPLIGSRLPDYGFSTSMEPIPFVLVGSKPTPKYFNWVEQYRLQDYSLKKNMNSAKHLIIAGSRSNLEKITLASLLAEKYEELGISSKGNLVEINVNGLVGQCIGVSSQYTDACDLVIIVSGKIGTIESFLENHPQFMKNFTNVPCRQCPPDEMLTIYKSNYSKEEGSSSYEANANMERILDCL